MTYTTADIAELFRLLDRRDLGGSEEAVATRLLLVTFEQVPKFAHRVTGLSIDRWRRGGRGDGDLLGLRDADGAVHVEIKSHDAQINWTEGACKRSGCSGSQSQLAHMVEDGCPVLLIAPPGARSARQLQNESEATRQALDHRTWTDLATALDAEPSSPFTDPIRAMLGV